MDIYKNLGIDTSKLGCVMLDLEVNPALKRAADALPESGWYRDPERPGEFGREGEPHVTLLHGLLNNANDLQEEVDFVLEDWRAPTYLRGRSCQVFKGEKYDVVYLKIIGTSEIHEAHQRLSKLPHVDLHPNFTPHMTVGYTLPGLGQWYANELQWDSDIYIKVKPDLNLGRLDEDSENRHAK